VVETKTFFDKRTALVLIDLQRGIAGRDTVPHKARDVIENAAKLVQAFRDAKLPAIFVRVLAGAEREDVLKPLVDNPAQTPTLAPDFAELVPELGVREDDIVVTKRNWGAFYGTDLDLQLRRRDVKRIVIGGISTNIGVESTARDAYERSYDLLFVEDAMAAMSAQEHEHSCRLLFPRMGIVRSTAEVLAALE
jgi:nicotinamidase-related amidase